MKILAIGGAAVLLGGMAYVVFAGREADVYALPVAEVHERLANAPFGQPGRSPFASFETSIHVEGPERIVYHASSAHAAHRCEVTLQALEAGRTRVDVSCAGGAPSDGVLIGAGIGMARNMIIELIDSTLTGRPYDRTLARGPTASWWPEDRNPPPTLREIIAGT